MNDDAVSTGPITLDDVRNALGDQDPAGTNAGALRRVIGRGSLSTIQRHLDAIRADLATPAPELDGEIPSAPKDLVQSIWASAWASAQARVQSELAKALGQAEGLRQELATAQGDAQSAQAEADQVGDTLAGAQARLKTLEAEKKEEMDFMEGMHAGALQALETALLEARQEAQQARQALELATARHAGDLAVLRGELDRQVSQLADLRAALQRPAPAPLAAAADPTLGDRHPE